MTEGEIKSKALSYAEKHWHKRPEGDNHLWVEVAEHPGLPRYWEKQDLDSLRITKHTVFVRVVDGHLVADIRN